MSTFSLGLDINDEISYDYYERWLKSGHKELQLGANYLTNQQLFWMALVRKFYVKFQPNTPQSVDPEGQLKSDYLHVVYKNQPGFQRAFECVGALSDAESKLLKEYQTKLSRL